MSIYQNRIDFIKRTKAFLTIPDENVKKYDKTFFLNCCMGLLVVPQQLADKHEQITIPGNVDYVNWGIKIENIKVNTPKKNCEEHSIDNIAYHFRNSLCHYLADVITCNVEKIKHIIIRDESPNGEQTFKLELSFDDFKKFVLKYADEVLNVLDTI